MGGYWGGGFFEGVDWGVEERVVGEGWMGEAYVMRQAVMVWKNSATEQRALERKLPMRLQRARTPRKSEQTAKKRPMRTKGNMKRVR